MRTTLLLALIVVLSAIIGCSKENPATAVFEKGKGDGELSVTADLDPPNTGCWVTVGGFIGTKDSKDHFTGQAAPLDDNDTRGGPGTGCWRHTTASGHTFVGDVIVITCLRDAGDPSGGGVFSNLAIIIAVGEWDGVSGYTAVISISDHGEPSTAGESDHYIFHVEDPNGTLIYSLDDAVDSGNVQIHSMDEPGWESIGPCGK